MQFRTCLLAGLALGATISVRRALGDTVSIVPTDFSSISDQTQNGTSQTQITTLPMVGVDISPSITDPTTTAYTLMGDDLNFRFTNVQTVTDFDTQNSGTIYFTPNENTTYSLSGSFSGSGQYDNFGVNLTQVFVISGQTYYAPRFGSSFVTGSLSDPSDPDLDSESGSLTGSLQGGGVYFLSYQTGPQGDTSTGGFVDLAIGAVPEPLSGASTLCALLVGLGMSRYRSVSLPGR